jgi:hypothetical protein
MPFSNAKPCPMKPNNLKNAATARDMFTTLGRGALNVVAGNLIRKKHIQTATVRLRGIVVAAIAKPGYFWLWSESPKFWEN